MINRITILISLFILFNIVKSQDIDFEEQGKNIISLSNLILTGETDSIRNYASQQMQELLKEILNTKKSYLHEFKETGHVSILQPKDKKFKIITWFIPYKSGELKYFGIIQTCNKRGKKCNTYILEDTQDLSQENINYDFQLNNWYGCLYYDLIITKIEKDTYYTLLGWDGNNNKTSKKMIEVLNVSKNQAPYFGANIFNNNKNRILIEYSSQYPISLKYDPELEYIVFDHLEPIDEISMQNFSLYAPNLSYDIFKKTKLGWILEEEIYLNNEK